MAIFLAGLAEIAWALGLKYSNGLTRLWPTIAMIASIVVSFCFLSIALKSLPFGTAYAIWTGIGAAGTIIIGIAVFGEPRDIIRIVCLILIVSGMIGLKLNSSL